MKANVTLTFGLKKIGLFILYLFLPFLAFCQPDYDFRNPVLISGTDLQVNAVYLFQHVKAGVDATVTVTDITGGIMLSSIDGPSGYTEALQPVLQVPAFASGYVELKVNFLVAGTNTPMIQTEVPATPIDVDGQTYADGTVNEFDVLQLVNGYINYDMLGGELSMHTSGSWVTGTNTKGTDYPGVDTTPRQVMFTTVNAGLSEFIFRTGASSMASASHQRLRSVYFKKFLYPNSFLPLPVPAFFKGAVTNETVLLQWQLQAGMSLKTIVVERALSPTSFSPVSSQATHESSSIYQFSDSKPGAGLTYYRLKMIDPYDRVSYSNTLVFSAGASTKQSFKIYPGVITDHASIAVSSSKEEQASLQLFDGSGRMVYQKKMQLQQGSNNISVSGFSALHTGIYSAVVTTGNMFNTQKVFIQ
jgi:hypothetical protein